MRRYLTVFLVILLAGVLGACSTNRATGKRQLNLLSPQQEISLGDEAAPQFLQDNGGPIPSEPIQQYVRNIGMELAALSERPNLPWEFHVLDSSVINAFALPGGKVFMSRGLMARLDNEAQLAGVLGHEIGHVTAKHINDQMAQRLAVSGVLAGLGVAAEMTNEQWLQVLGIGAQVGGSVYLLKFGREDEIEADSLGLRYMSRAGYNPVGQLQVMQILKNASAGPGSLEILSTHPLPDTRIRRIEQIIKKEYPQYEDPGAYQFNFDRYRVQVLEPLAKLPPPKHGGSPK